MISYHKAFSMFLQWKQMCCVAADPSQLQREARVARVAEHIHSRLLKSHFQYMYRYRFYMFVARWLLASVLRRSFTLWLATGRQASPSPSPNPSPAKGSPAKVRQEASSRSTRKAPLDNKHKPCVCMYGLYTLQCT